MSDFRSSVLADEWSGVHIRGSVSPAADGPMSQLFSPFTLRELTLRNRTVIAPMCQYSAQHGYANDWHLVHLGRFALGGFGLVILEATGVNPEGRISYGDLGLWSDDHIKPLKHIAEFLHSQGAAAGIQLAHAGRKASTPIAWRHGFDETEAEKPQVAFESWTPIAPSPIIHSEKTPGYTTPREMTEADISSTVQAFADAAQRAAAVVAELELRNTGRGIPFCEELVRRSFGVFFSREAEREREEKAGSVLVTPDDIRAEQARARGRTRR